MSAASSSSLPQSVLQDRRLYEVLCIENFSSCEEVRVAYKSLALKNHPDKNIGDPSAADRFREISRAYEVLVNPEHKKRYDVALRIALASYGGRNGGTGHLGSNPYSVNPVSMSDVYADLYRRQAERAATRSRTVSQPPKEPNKSTSQYTKAQQELFRKRERARQQELRKQLEKEKREQRERERAALRREQERQEELLQHRWQQQQQQQRSFAPRTATRATGMKRTGSSGAGSARYTATNSGSARGAEGNSRTITPRATTAATTGAEDGLSGRRTPVTTTPNTVRVGTPARNGTPRVRRAGAFTPSPGRRSTDRLNATPPATPTPMSFSKDDDDEEVMGVGVGVPPQRRNTADADTGNGDRGAGEGWYSPLTSPIEDSEHAPHNRTLSNDSRRSNHSDGDDRDVEAAVTSSSIPEPNPFMGFTNGDRTVTPSATAESSSPLQCSPHHPTTTTAAAAAAGATTASTTSSSVAEGHHSTDAVHHHRHSAGLGKDEEGANLRKASLTNYSSHRRPSNSSSGTLGSGAAVRTYSPRMSTKTTTAAAAKSSGVTRTATPRRGTTPHGQQSSTTTTTTRASHGRGTSPSTSTPRATRGASARPFSSSARAAAAATTAARANSPLPSSKTTASAAAAPANPPFLHRMRVTPGLAESDKELLEKQRRERLAKEKERQRAARLAEEERQFKRAARAVKQQKAADGAAVAEAVQLSWVELLTYIQTDETSERQQFIEREEQLAWRRLHRQHISVLAEVVFKKRFAALTMEESVRRNWISSTARQNGLCLHCTFQEWCERCAVEWREGRDRRQLKGREAADSYHAQRLFQRRTALLAEEAAQRRLLAAVALGTIIMQYVTEGEALARASVLQDEHTTRYLLLTSFMAETSRQAKREQAIEEAARQSREHQQQEQEDGDWHVSPAAWPFLQPPAMNSDARSGTSNCNNSNSNPEALRVKVVTVAPLTGKALTPSAARAAEANSAGGEQRQPAAAAAAAVNSMTIGAPATLPAAERRLQLFFAEETRLRSLIVSQQHCEEVALRRRRATALHRAFAKEKEEAVRQAQKAAQAELRAVQAELRLLQQQQQQQRGPSTRSMPPRNGSLASSVTPPLATGPSSPTTLPRQQKAGASTDVTPAKLGVVVVSAPPTTTAAISTTAVAAEGATRTPSLSAPAGAAGKDVVGIATVTAVPPRCHVVSMAGWKTLSDSDVEDTVGV